MGHLIPRRALGTRVRFITVPNLLELVLGLVVATK
jgi:hypothetical protein